MMHHKDIQTFIDTIRVQQNDKTILDPFITYQYLPSRVVANSYLGFCGHTILTINKLYLQKEKREPVIKAYLLHELGHAYSHDLKRKKTSAAAEARAHAWAIHVAIYQLKDADIAGHLIKMGREWSSMPKRKCNLIYIRASKILSRKGVL